MFFQHHRFQVWSAIQHPYRHNLDEFFYSNPAAPGVSGIGSALDYMFAVLYPQSKPAVANVAALPTLGNTINDMRVVSDDGDGKAASYRWEQREGDVAPKWYKIYDLDWGTDSILQGFLLKTQDIYVKQRGYNDLDSSGVPVAGVLAGQSVYGGASANTNLTLFANSGDGVGATTGYVQFGDNVRPTTHNTFDLGTNAVRFKDFYGATGRFGTLLLSAGSITDTSGAINFDNENLSTSGSITAGTLLLSSGSVTDSSGGISFDDEDLTTTGTGTFNHIVATGAASQFFTGTTVADFTFTNGNIASSSATVSFNALNLLSTGIGTFGQLNIDNLRLDNNRLSVTNSNGNLELAANGSGVINALSAITSLGIAATGNFSVTDGSATVSGTGALLDVDNVRLDGNTISTTNSNGNLLLSPNGTGLIEMVKAFFPTTSAAFDIGKTGNVWQKLWISGSIGGATEITISDLLALRNVNYRDTGRTQPAQSGDALFYNGSQWLASVPDSEISHGGLSNLLVDDHTQYALLAGRSGGQSLIGGTAASNSLTFESTSNGTKGFIQFKDTLRPFADASFSGSWSGVDHGDATHNFRHLYMKGEAFGFRVENVGVLPSPSTQNIGRLVYLADDIYVDTGTAFKQISRNSYLEDTVWDGTAVSKTVTVSDLDARRALWQLRDNSNQYQQMDGANIRATAATTVVITFGTNNPPPAGSYRLMGVE